MPVLTNGFVELCKIKPEDPLVSDSMAVCQGEDGGGGISTTKLKVYVRLYFNDKLFC